MKVENLIEFFGVLLIASGGLIVLFSSNEFSYTLGTLIVFIGATIILLTDIFLRNYRTKENE